MKKIIKWICIVFVLLVVLGMVLDAMKSPEEKAADAAAVQKKKSAEAAEKIEALKREMDSLPAVTPIQLDQAYAENTVTADQLYKGKRFKVTGTVTNINTDFMGNPYITMGGSNPFMEPQFSFEKSQSEQIARIKKGSRLTLVCVGKGDVAKTPMSSGCSII